MPDNGARESRIGRLVRRYPLPVAGLSVSELVIRVASRFTDVRVMGLAAEITYYALLSAVPLIGALGASLGFMERLLGADAVMQAETAIIAAMETVFTADVSEQVITPMVQDLLRQERGGFALGSFLVSLFFASRIFRSAIDTLDATYRVEERRSTVALWGLGLLFSLGALLLTVVLLAMVVIGPLLGGGRALADLLGLDQAFEVVWAVARWPLVFLIGIAFLSTLYRFGPNVRHSWREGLPGAVFGIVGVLLVSLGFRLYISLTGLDSPDIDDAAGAVGIVLQFLGALMAALFWVWLSAMMVLTGGVVNGELARMRRGPPREAE